MYFISCGAGEIMFATPMFYTQIWRQALNARVTTSRYNNIVMSSRIHRLGKHCNLKEHVQIINVYERFLIFYYYIDITTLTKLSMSSVNKKKRSLSSAL